MKFDTPITIALSKGRIFDQSMPLLAHAGIVAATGVLFFGVAMWRFRFD